MGSNRASPGAGDNARTPKDLIGDIATYVSSGGGLALLISVAVGASRSPVLWGCGVALVILFVCVLFWRYDVIGVRPRWRRMAFFAAMGVSAIVVPLAGLLQLVFPPRFHPQTAEVKDCQPAGTVGSYKHGAPPPGIPDDPSISVYKCSAESSVTGYVPVYLAPGTKDTVGGMNGDIHPWFVCWISGPDAPAWYYTEGDVPEQTAYPENHVWGVVASSRGPDAVVPVCPPQIRQVIMTAAP